MELTEDRFTQPYRGSFYHAGDDTANGVALVAHLLNKLNHLLGDIGIGTANHIIFNPRKVVNAVIIFEGNPSHLRSVCFYIHIQPVQVELSYPACHDTRDGFARRRTPPTPVITYPVLLLVGIVGVRRPENIL